VATFPSLPFPSLDKFILHTKSPSDQYLILDNSTLYFTVISFCTAQNQMKKQLSYVFEKNKSNEKKYTVLNMKAQHGVSKQSSFLQQRLIGKLQQ